jgi:hypothetical protein
MRRIGLHEMGAGYLILTVTTVVPRDIKIPAPEPIFPLGHSHLALGCERQIMQDFLTAGTRKLAKDRDGAITFGFLGRDWKLSK